MPRNGYSKIGTVSPLPPRDSLELASLASSIGSNPTSPTSSPSGISSSRKLSLQEGEEYSGVTAAEGATSSHHLRTYSVSSTFDFANTLFPLSTTAAGYTALGTPIYDPLEGPSLERHKSLTYLNGLSLIVGLIIGSGIFSSPSQVDVNAGSPGASLIVWTIAGILAWTGAASFAELGGAIPLNGGAQVYLSKIFGDLSGFLFTWCAVFVLKPGSAAIIAIVFGEYVVRAAVGAEALTVDNWINKGVAIGGLAMVTILNCISTRLGTKLGDVFLVLKFLALLGVTVIGGVVAATGYSFDGKIATEWKTESWFEGTNTDLSNWAVALYAGLWAFDGWDNTSYVVGEFLNSARDLPRVIHTAMPIVILSYLLANTAYILVLPPSVIDSSNTVAVKFGAVVFGPVGSLVFAIVVSLSCFGALNATTFTSGRLVYAAGKEGFLPGLFGRIGMPGTQRQPTSLGVVKLEKKGGVWGHLRDWVGDEGGSIAYTPINAMLFNSALTLVYIVAGEFGTLVTFYGVAGYTFYFLTVLGLIVLRFREPFLERPYKTWITTPVIFCCVSLFLLTRAVVAEPVQTLIVIAFVILGVPVYYWRVSRRSKITGVRISDWKFWERWRRA